MVVLEQLPQPRPPTMQQHPLVGPGARARCTPLRSGRARRRASRARWRGGSSSSPRVNRSMTSPASSTASGSHSRGAPRSVQPPAHGSPAGRKGAGRPGRPSASLAAPSSTRPSRSARRRAMLITIPTIQVRAASGPRSGRAPRSPEPRLLDAFLGDAWRRRTGRPRGAAWATTRGRPRRTRARQAAAARAPRRRTAQECGTGHRAAVSAPAGPLRQRFGKDRHAKRNSAV